MENHKIKINIVGLHNPHNSAPCDCASSVRHVVSSFKDGRAPNAVGKHATSNASHVARPRTRIAQQSKTLTSHCAGTRWRQMSLGPKKHPVQNDLQSFRNYLELLLHTSATQPCETRFKNACVCVCVKNEHWSSLINKVSFDFPLRSVVHTYPSSAPLNLQSRFDKIGFTVLTDDECWHPAWLRPRCIMSYGFDWLSRLFPWSSMIILDL